MKITAFDSIGTAYAAEEIERYKEWEFRLMTIHALDANERADAILLAVNMDHPEKSWVFRQIPFLNASVDDVRHICGVDDTGTWVQVFVGPVLRCNLDIQTGKILDLIYDMGK